MLQSAAAAQGRKAQQAGKSFESVVDRVLAVALEVGLVKYVDKSQPGWRMIAAKQFIRTERSGADRHGIVWTGSAFGIECKTCGHGERLNFKSDFTKKGEVKRQVIHLEALGRLGFKVAPIDDGGRPAA
jgi:hypothetical protein